MKTIKNMDNKTLCMQSYTTIKLLTSRTILSTYKKYINSIATQFTTNHKQLLEKIFLIKQNSEFKAILQSTILDETTRIPPIIDIIKYLFMDNIYNSNFTHNELSKIQNVLNTYTNKQLYKYFHKDEQGIIFINKIFDIYHKLHNTLDLNKFSSLKFHELLINKFTSIQMLEYIEQLNTLSKYSLTYNNDVKHDLLYIYHKSTNNSFSGCTLNNKSHNKLKCYNIANNILKRVIFFNELLNNNILPNKIIIFLTDQKKEIDNELYNAISRDKLLYFRTFNVNSAVTNSQDIIIYRKEELFKSIFHELIHFHHMDFHIFPTINNNNILSYITKTHNILITNEYLLYESITESLANILNNIYSNRTKKISNFRNNLTKEIIFSTYQVGKILKLCDYTCWDEFILINGYVTNPKKQFKQDSCVFSYYILKLYLLLNLDEYWTTLLDNNLKFITTPENLTKLINIFEKGRTNKYLAKFINSLLKHKKTLKTTNYKQHYNSTSIKHTHKFKNNNIHKTLRMTCIE